MGALLNGRTAVLAALLSVCAPVSLAQAPRPVELEQLEPQDLNPGECGMFLWTRDGRQTLVFAAFDKPRLARLRADGHTWSIPRTAFRGEANSGHFEHQRFANDDMTVDADIVFDEETKLADGAVVRDGVVRIVSRRGWETVVPVGGMTACKPKEDRRSRS
jgi:hypothetical protein